MKNCVLIQQLYRNHIKCSKKKNRCVAPDSRDTARQERGTALTDDAVIGAASSQLQCQPNAPAEV